MTDRHQEAAPPTSETSTERPVLVAEGGPDGNRWRIVRAALRAPDDPSPSEPAHYLELDEGPDLLGRPRWSPIDLADDDPWHTVVRDFASDRIGDIATPEDWSPPTRTLTDADLHEQHFRTPELVYENPTRTWRIVAWTTETDDALYRVHSIEARADDDLLGGERWIIPSAYHIDQFLPALQEWLDEKLDAFYSIVPADTARHAHLWDWRR